VKHWDYIAIALIIWFAWWYVDQNSGAATFTGLGSDFASLWAQAISGAEKVNPIYNNPDGLNGGNFSGMVGTTPATGGGVIDIFSSVGAGFAAAEQVLNNFIAKYGGKSLLDATAIYVLGPTGAAGYNGNYPANVTNEANYVAGQLGVPVTATLNDLSGDE
jgi:hypothetical protein